MQDTHQNADWLVQPFFTYLFGVETITGGVIHVTGACKGEFSRSMRTCFIVKSLESLHDKSIIESSLLGSCAGPIDCQWCAKALSEVG